MKVKHSRESALEIATELMQHMDGALERIEIAGSIRRKRAMVGDVELLFIPKMVPGVKVDIFADAPLCNAAEARIAWMEDQDIIGRRKAVTGRTAGWGPENKLAVHMASGIPVDLFATTLERWFMALVIRTGPRDFNLRLIESARKRGLALHAYGTYTRITTGEVVPCNSEREVLELAGLPWMEPEFRK